MTQRSKRHHEVPNWLLKNFCIDGSDHLWVGFRRGGKVQKMNREKVFVRKNANTRLDYIPDGSGELKRVPSDSDEGILSDFDDRTSKAARQLLQWARQYHKTGETPPCPPQDDVVNHCKALIVTQARRPHESQDRVGLTEGYEKRWWDLAYKRAKDVGFELAPREELTLNPKMQTLVSDMEQNQRANFASGDHPILKDKENRFLLEAGLGVGVIIDSGPRLVVGNQGITILKESSVEMSLLPLAPDVVVCLTPRPQSLTSWTCRASFVGQHNKAAYTMSRAIAGNSKQVIEGLLETLGH